MTTEEQEQVSQEPVSETKEEEKPEQSYVTREELQEALSAAKETGRREGQSSKDREIADVRRRYEGELESYKTSFNSLDEETRQGIELAKYRSQDQYNQASSQQEAYFENLNKSLMSHLEQLGIDPEDKRIDWAQEPNLDFIAGRTRFDASVAKILKQDEGKRMSDLEKKLMAKIEEENLKNRVDSGLESVDTSTSAGVSDTDADFLNKFGRGEVPYTKENKERAEKLMQ